MGPASSIFSIELWTRSGQLMGDLSGLAKNRRFVESRNEAEEISFEVEMATYEKYCRSIFVDPAAFIIPGQTEVRLARNGTYIGGGVIDYALPRLTPTEQVWQFKASGFLNRFVKRYTGTWPSGTVQESFTAVEATTIAQTLITQSQALTNGDLGITFGEMATVGVHDRTYETTQIKNALQDLTKVVTAPFDFKFSATKVFSTYAQLGSYRPDIVFEYPGNIVINLEAPIDATNVVNEVKALGAGFGTEATEPVFDSDTGSQDNYGLCQEVITTNGTDDSDGGVTDAAKAYKTAFAFPFQIPGFTYRGGAIAFTDYALGDSVKVRILDRPSLPIDGEFRIEKRELVLGDDDSEEVTIYVD